MTTHELITLLMALDSSEEMGVYIKKGDGAVLPCVKVYIDKGQEIQFLVIE